MNTRLLLVAAAMAIVVQGTGASAQTYPQAVQAANPDGYFRLTTPTTGSSNGAYTTTYSGSVATGPGAPIASDPANTGAVFDGVNSGSSSGIITTSLSGGVPGAGTILAWVNLATLPSTKGTMYVAGESQVGNDFDLQFEGDNALRFYTGGGENTAYSPDASTLVGQWHMIAATYDATLGGNSFRDIYWDGVLGSSFTGGVNAAGKSSPFTIGYSPVFGNREFDGSIDEVAVYDHALSASQIASIYASASNTGVVGSVPEPASWAMMILGVGMIGAGMRWTRRRTTLRYA